MEIIYDSKGLPAMFASSRIFGVTQTPKETIERTNDTFSVGKREFVCWGSSNQYPAEAEAVIGRTGVLSTGLGFKARATLGQGVVPMDVDGFDAHGDMVLKPCQDKDVQQFFRSWQCMSYMSAAFRDLFKFGNCYPVFFFNEKGDKIVRITVINARHCRLSVDKKHLLVYNDFDKSMPDEKNSTLITMLDEGDPFLDLELLKNAGKLKGQSIAFPRLKNYFSNSDYYALPDWDSAMKSGWIEIANKIPKFLAKSYANAMTLMWHVKVPRTYWEKHFPKNDYKTTDERKKAIEQFMTDMENNLCGEENVSKAFFSTYGLGASGKDEGWEIERLENEIDAKERLSTSAAANSEILFSLMINPSVFGAGMPGGAYAGNAGSGSDIRESFLVSIVTTYIEKQQVLFPILLMLKFNGHSEDIILKYKETILTTLNTGQSKEDITT